MKRKKFELEDFEKTKFCLNLRIEYFRSGVLFYQSTYIEKVLKHFYMNKSYSFNSPMVVHSLKVNKNSFHPNEDSHEMLGQKVSYLNAMGALIYFVDCA